MVIQKKQVSSAWEDDEDEDEDKDGVFLYSTTNHLSVGRDRIRVRNKKTENSTEISMVPIDHSVDNKNKNKITLTPKAIIQKLKRKETNSSKNIMTDTSYSSLVNEMNEMDEGMEFVHKQQTSIFKGKSLSTPKYKSISDNEGEDEDDDNDPLERDLNAQNSTAL